MADTLPADTTSPAIAELTRLSNGRYTPSVDELLRQAAAARHLVEVTAGLEMTLDDYVKRGLDREWHHQIDDPAVPYSPYLNLGGQS